ncbi:MAG: DNA polymerase III subunit gamma/tau [Gammaproteobacteria bacterium]|nr:DNA polymerase III subunit gamma/tau [Gammaproteobacteria bacterium]
MTYQALARKYRPRHFGELVGQEHVMRALVNALDNDRLHHAFLFTGTRGVGKTTIARILAKSLNCEKGVSSKPCGECSACNEIDEGRFVDLIEVDAASRTKVDDTRELLDNVQYSPTRGRYKVYLVDEVHMLSKSSFNALLKTLEEPPPHVKFLFATTDPQKVPVTVLSRCLQFGLKRLPFTLIESHLQNVLGQEGVEADPAAIRLVAHAADGSMRDALSLLDQAIAFGGGALKEAEVRAMLGTIERQHVFGLLEALASGDGKALLEAVHALDSQAPDYRLVAQELAVALQRVARFQAVPAGTEEWEDRDEIAAIAEKLPREDVQLYYQIIITGQRELDFAPEPRSAFEMLLLRLLAFQPAVDAGNPGGGSSPSQGGEQASGNAKKTASSKPATSSAQEAVTESQAAPREEHTAPERAAPSPAQPTPKATETPVKEPAPKATETPVKEPAPKASAAHAEGPREWRDPDWNALIDALNLRGVTRQLALNCAFERREGSVIHLRIAPAHEQMLTRALQERLEQALSRFYREELKLKIAVGDVEVETPAQKESRRQEERMVSARASMQGDPNVQAIQQMFDATLDEDSIRPRTH